MHEDVLQRLDRVLDVTPEHAYATQPLPRKLVAQAAAEIRLLRARIAQLRAQASMEQEAKEAG